MSRTANKHERKAKKSYTLSTEVIAFLEGMRQQRRAESVSAVLEEILQDVRRGEERASVERAVANYYSSLSDDEAAEQEQWGEFALREFPREKRA